MTRYTAYTKAGLPEAGVAPERIVALIEAAAR